MILVIDLLKSYHVMLLLTWNALKFENVSNLNATWISNGVVVFMFNDLRWEMIVRFVDIDGIFYHCHYCLKFLFIALISLFWKTKTRRQVDNKPKWMLYIILIRLSVHGLSGHNHRVNVGRFIPTMYIWVLIPVCGEV